MALTSSIVVNGQTTTGYLFEPLYVRFTATDDDINTALRIALIIYNTDGTVYSTISDVFVSEFIPTNPQITVNLTSIASRYIVNYVDYLSDPITGNSIANKYYVFNITSHTHDSYTIFPIIGSRSFQQISFPVDVSVLTEYDYYGVDPVGFIGYPLVSQSIGSVPTAGDPWTITVSKTIPTEGEDMCGAYLVWKSKFGGWMTYGFPFYQETTFRNVKGELGRETFTDESVLCLKPDYTAITYSNGYSVKDYSVQNDMAKCVEGIKASPIVYICRNDGGNLTYELVRVTGASISPNSITDGVNLYVDMVSMSSNEVKLF